MHRELFALLILGLLSLCVVAIPPWIEHSRHPGNWPPRRQDYHRDPNDRYRPQNKRCRFGRICNDQIEDDFGLDYEDDGGREVIGCSCLLYVENRVVFRRADNNRRYPCSRRGLQNCSTYCDNLFQDEGLRASSRQDACDVLGREVHTQWYRKEQVCGSSGPYKDTPLTTNLCCRQGRSSLDCSN